MARNWSTRNAQCNTDCPCLGPGRNHAHSFCWAAAVPMQGDNPAGRSYTWHVGQAVAVVREKGVTPDDQPLIDDRPAWVGGSCPSASRSRKMVTTRLGHSAWISSSERGMTPVLPDHR